MKTLHIPCDPGEISDGYHTFNELYDHRCTLFLALMASNPTLSWISAKHHDGSEWEGWFIAGMEMAFIAHVGADRCPRACGASE